MNVASKNTYSKEELNHIVKEVGFKIARDTSAKIANALERTKENVLIAALEERMGKEQTLIYISGYELAISMIKEFSVSEESE